MKPCPAYRHRPVEIMDHIQAQLWMPEDNTLAPASCCACACSHIPCNWALRFTTSPSPHQHCQPQPSHPLPSSQSPSSTFTPCVWSQPTALTPRTPPCSRGCSHGTMAAACPLSPWHSCSRAPSVSLEPNPPAPSAGASTWQGLTLSQRSPHWQDSCQGRSRTAYLQVWMCTGASSGW
jgi:hypothetical protein